MITGEERLREYLVDLYSNVVGYEGRPSQTQMDRTETLRHQLSDVTNDFNAWANRELADLNPQLAQKNQDQIKLLTREEWNLKNPRR